MKRSQGFVGVSCRPGKMYNMLSGRNWFVGLKSQESSVGAMQACPKVMTICLNRCSICMDGRQIVFKTGLSLETSSHVITIVENCASGTQVEGSSDFKMGRSFFTPANIIPVH